MKIAMMVLIVLLATGCRTYGIEKGVDEAGNAYVKVNVTSSADIEAPTVHYLREGETVEFDFSADSVDSNTQDFLSIFQSTFAMMLEMMKANMLLAQPQ